MSGATSDAQKVWIERVLGVTPAGGEGDGGAAAFREAWAAAWDTWLDAIDTVDAQIDVLGRAMRATGDEGLQNIADNRLPTIFDGVRMPLVAAGMQISRATDAALAGGAADAQKAIAGFVRLLATDKKIAACDESDFGVSVSIRGTLGPALKKLADAVKRSPKQA